MNMKKKQICRLCFNVTENAFEIKDGVINEIFDVLLLKINSDVNEHPVMCHNCMELVKKIFNFKLACIYTERSILFPVADNPESRFQLNSVYKGGQIIETAVDKKFKMCRLCMKLLDEINFMSIDLLMNNTVFAVLMPEIDLDIAKDPVICISCKENLEQYFRFMWHCLNAEEIRCRKFEDVKDIPKGANEGTTKQEDALGQTGNIDSGIVDVLLLIENIQKPAIKQEADVFDMNGSGLIKIEDCQIKDKNVFVDEKSPKISSKTKKMIYNCECCDFKTNNKRNLKTHSRIHLDASQVRKYMCLLCPYVAKQRGHLVTHMLIHKDAREIQMHKCAICNFESKYKKNLKVHMLNHKNTIEVQMHKCLQCTYETKLKNNLKKHMLKHRDPSEMEMYRCTICSFKTKYKGNLKIHMLSHRKSLEGGRYKCINLFVYKELSQIETYKCSACSFETKLKDYLKRHMIMHKNRSEVERYKCTSCTYETKYKRTIQRHFLAHKK